jgi:outer membrane biogenesis lipoprotein LolB
MKPLFLITLFGLSALFLTSCASTEEDPTKADREKVSTVPWNKPQSWEGKGALGGLVQ